MGLTSVLRGLAAVLAAIAVAMVPPFLLALSGGEAIAGPFLFAIIATVFGAAGLRAASIGKRPPSDFRGALLIILLWWTVAPAFAAIPFALDGMTPPDAYFEAIAALTTTGGWISHETATASPAAMLWRAELQWLGGFASIAIAAAIFIRPAFIGIDTLLPPFSRGDKGNFMRPLRNAITAFASTYGVLTFLAFGAFAATGATTLDAVVLAMSGVATGGFAPAGVDISGASLAMQLVTFAVIIVSASNFVVLARFVRGAKGRGRDVEGRAYFAIIISVGVLFWLLAGAGDIRLIAQQIFNSASMLSTTGFVVGEAPPVPVALVTAIIGGAAVSTAGGFKILRWLVIMRRAYEELRRLAEPSAVFGKRRVSNEMGVWIHFLVFTMTLAALTVVLMFGGERFELAATAAVSALANTGPLIYLVDGGADGYAAFGEGYRWALAGAMVLGRLEAAVALVLFNRWFWRT
ncbi:MAG: potassium transporter TrkG [Pseudomonadota bacterium]